MRACFTGTSRYGGEQEGYAVRAAAAFPEGEFGLRVARFVRPGHVPDEAAHWGTAWRPARVRDARP